MKGVFIPVDVSEVLPEKYEKEQIKAETDPKKAGELKRKLAKVEKQLKGKGGLNFWMWVKIFRPYKEGMAESVICSRQFLNHDYSHG